MIKLNIIKFIVGLTIYALPFTVNAELVNINDASAAAMSKNLQGIGAKKAESIVSYREINGDFEKVSDITNVKGIGEGLLKKNLEDMSLTEGVTKLVKVNAKEKLVVIEPKKIAKPKVKLQDSKKVALNAGKKVSKAMEKNKKAKMKLGKTKAEDAKKVSGIK